MAQAEPQTRFDAGELIGDFRVVRELGRGTTGVVYEAAHKDSGQKVAAKVLLPAISLDPQFAMRFPFASRSISLVRHPHLAELINFSMRPDRTTFLVSELLDGETLKARLDRGPLPEAEAIPLGRQIALALASAEDTQHLNLHPGNVMLVQSPQGEIAKVLDFGVSKLAGAAPGAEGYRAPEQAAGGGTDGKTDVYALGCLLHKMMIGLPPTGGVAPLLKGKIAELLTAMLTPAPAARPTMREVAQRLAELDGSGTADAIEAARKKTLAGQGVPGRSTVAWAQAVVDQRKAQRKERKDRRGQGGRGPGLLILLGTLLVLAIVITSVAVVRSRQAKEREAAARLPTPAPPAAATPSPAKAPAPAAPAAAAPAEEPPLAPMAGRPMKGKRKGGKKR